MIGFARQVTERIRLLVRRDPRTQAEIASAAWPDSSEIAAERRLRRLLARTGAQQLRPSDAERLAEVLGVKPKDFYGLGDEIPRHDPKPMRGDAADVRQREEYEAAQRRGKDDVAEPEACLRYRLDLWRRRRS